jgi:OOP family OmpA-OmpF porin
MLLGLPIASADDDTGWYAGIAVNRLDADFEDRSDLDFDDSDDTASIKLGYMFNPWFGLEGGYLDLGDYTGGSGLSIDADAFQFAGVLNWEVVGILDVYGKLGAFFVNADSDQFIPGFGRVEEDDDATEAYAGIGAELDFGTWNLFGEFSAVDTDVSDLTIDIITFGVKYEFGR